jgi:excisionase family DNA binding protein
MGEKAALYVRVPAHVMASVDELVRATGRTKQALITEFVENAVCAAPTAQSPADTSNGPKICDLDEVAEMLRVSPEQVLARVADGALPGRLFGNDWRFSRDAVMRWLDEADRPVRAPGFAR